MMGAGMMVCCPACGAEWYQHYMNLLGVTVVIAACVVVLIVVAALLLLRMRAVRKQSECLEQMRQDFTSNISHELRTPITVLRGSLEALRDGIVTDAEKTHDYHHAMLRETAHLERLVNDLLDLTKLQNADFVIELVPVDLDTFWDDVVAGAQVMAERRGVDVCAHKTVSDATIMGDYGRLRQMLFVLIDNATKFSSKGQQIELVCTNDSFIVRDDGPGIDPRDLPHIFDRFQQTRYGGSASQGTGLGLSIAQQIAHRHGMNIVAYSDGTNGTTMTVENVKEIV